MPTQRYTRWRTNEVDDDEFEDGVVIVERVEDEAQEESRQSFTLMTPQRDTKPPSSPIMTCRMICTITLILLIAFTLGVLIGYLATSRGLDIEPPNLPICFANKTNNTEKTTSAPPIEERDYKPEEYSALMEKLVFHLTPAKIEKYLGNLNKTPADDLGDFIKQTFVDQGYPTHKLGYLVQSSLPDDRNPNSVEAVFKNGSIQVVSESTSDRWNFSAFNAFSPSGMPSGCLVYSHHATIEDLEILNGSGTPIEGCIFLVRVGKLHPGMQVENAARFGASGVLFYPDPSDFGVNGTDSASSSLPPDGVVWESLRYIPGDPSTPGIASQHHIYRVPEASFSQIPPIPAQPISSNSAQYLLGLLDGDEVPDEWKGLLPIQYNFGGSFLNASNVKEIRLSVSNKLGASSVKSVHAFHSSIDSRSFTIHIGCRYEIRHGQLTGSSGIGLASLLALAEAIHIMHPQGSVNNVLFSAFQVVDTDESASFEFMELYAPWISATGVAYIDLDNILEGTGFFEGRATPLLRELLIEALGVGTWPEDPNMPLMTGIHRAGVNYHFMKYDGFLSSFTDSFTLKMPLLCSESGLFLTKFGVESVHLSAIGFNKSDSYLLKNTQYDTIDAISNLDPQLKWTHSVVSTLGVVALVLSSQLPPVNFDELAINLRMDFNDFKDNNLAGYISGGEFEDFLSSFSYKLNNFQLRMSTLNIIAADINKEQSPLKRRLQIYSGFQKILEISRYFLRPSSAAPSPSAFGSLLTYGPDPNDPCSGVAFPMARATLEDIKANKTDPLQLQREMSYVYSILSYLIDNVHIFRN